MVRVAVIIDSMFEDSEYKQSVQAFREEGYSIIHLGLKAGAEVAGKKEGTKVKIDKAIKEVKVDDFDALLIPGGYSPDHLRVDSDAVEFVKEFVNKQKPVFSICHGPQLLITADVLGGRKITGWKSIVQDIKNAGAQYLNQEVVQDGNLISSRQPSDLPAFIEAALSQLH